MAKVIGIDVGGIKKGYHAALGDSDSRRILGLRHFARPSDLAAWVAEQKPSVVAIDGPRCALIEGPDTRAAERELVRDGFRVQFTRIRGRHEPPEWMMQSVEIWRLIEKLVPEARVIEVFPTAAARNLLPSTDWAMPLQLLAGDTGWRKGYKDLCDAAIAALVAAGFLEGTIGCWGEDDEVNPIYGK